MINFAVINLKSTIKNFIKIIIVLLFVIGIINVSDLLKGCSIKLDFVYLVKNNISFSFENSLEQSSLKKIIISEMPILVAGNNISETNIDNINPSTTIEDVVENEQLPETVSTNQDLRNLSTNVVSENNISENYNTIYEDVRIKNETSFELTEDILTADIEYTNTKDIIIFHTHTCESYTMTDANQYVLTRKL